MQAKDYYRILGVGETATAEEIKKAYRKIAKHNHPDQNPGDTAAEDRFKEASEAYSILCDDEKRQRYDALRRYGFGEAGHGPGGFPGGPGGFPGGVRFSSGPGGQRFVHFDQDTGDADFADLFGDNSPFSSIFEQLFQGRGPGFQTHAQPRANGRGRGGSVRPDVSGDDFFRADGLDVHCTVWLKLNQLDHGAKVKVRTPQGKKVVVKVPQGTAIGSKLRLRGMGLTNGNLRGDQYVHIQAVE